MWDPVSIMTQKRHENSGEKLMVGELWGRRTLLLCLQYSASDKRHPPNTRGEAGTWYKEPYNSSVSCPGGPAARKQGSPRGSYLSVCSCWSNFGGSREVPSFALFLKVWLFTKSPFFFTSPIFQEEIVVPAQQGCEEAIR